MIAPNNDYKTIQVTTPTISKSTNPNTIILPKTPSSHKNKTIETIKISLTTPTSSTSTTSQENTKTISR